MGFLLCSGHIIIRLRCVYCVCRYLCINTTITMRWCCCIFTFMWIMVLFIVFHRPALSLKKLLHSLKSTPPKILIHLCLLWYFIKFWSFLVLKNCLSVLWIKELFNSKYQNFVNFGHGRILIITSLYLLKYGQNISKYHIL